MTVNQAYKILGLAPRSEFQIIKKQYRNLMMRFHPDADIYVKEKYAYSAQDINMAYSILKEALSSGTVTNIHDKEDGSFRSSQEQPTVIWNAPESKDAYREREILHYVEDAHGTVLGRFCVAKGKYMWTVEEEFPLFLLSIYECGKQLLDEIDMTLCRKASPEIRPRLQAELTYLLAQQFIDGMTLLQEFAREEKTDNDGSRIFYISSTLESLEQMKSSEYKRSLQAGESLFPSGIKQHRLYIKNQMGQELGYLSFPDDRLYYVVIPLLEQRSVQIKIQVCEHSSGKKRAFAANYHKLHLWLKLREKDLEKIPDNLNLQIEHLLQLYAKDFNDL